MQTASEPAENKPEEQAQSTQDSTQSSHTDSTTEASSSDSQSEAEENAVTISQKEQKHDAEASSLDGEPEAEDIAKAESSAEEPSKIEKKSIVDLTELQNYIDDVSKFNKALDPIKNEIAHVKTHSEKFSASQILSDKNKFTQADKDALSDIKAKIALIKQSANESINKLQETSTVLKNLETDLSQINQDEVILQFSDTKIQSPDEIKSKIEALSQQIEELKKAQEQLKDNIEKALNTGANSLAQLETQISALDSKKTEHVQKQITINGNKRLFKTKKVDYSDGALKNKSSTGIKYSQSDKSCTLTKKAATKGEGIDTTTGLSNYAVTCVEMLYNQYTERGTTKEYPIETYDIETVQIICAAAKAIGIPKEKLHFWAKGKDGKKIEWPQELITSTYAAMSTHKNIPLEPFDGTKLGTDITSPQDFYTHIKHYTQTIQAFEHRDLEAGFKNKRKLHPEKQALGTSIDNIGFFENNADRNVKNFVAQGNEVHESLKLKK